jgi:AraC-like DNA-binding protein
MNYQQILPAEPLRKYVRYFWTLEDDSLDYSHKAFKILPDGLPGIIFQENPKAFFDENNKQLPQLFLYGQTTQYTESKAISGFRNIGVYFQPTALKSIFGIDANELTDQYIDINDLTITNITDQLSSKNTYQQRIELLSAFFTQQADRQKTESEKVNFATIKLQKGESLKNIQSKLNISERSLERHFKQQVGISPKLYARICRFQSALENLRKMKFEKLTDIAHQSDYFDQSHFIREFKGFAGTIPKQFMIQANEQVANFPEWKL